MADDINKKISIDVQINSDGQQQATQYKAAFDDLRNSIGKLGKPLADLSNNIRLFDKDVNKLTETGDLFFYANSSIPIFDNRSVYATLSGALIENFEFFTTSGYTIGPANTGLDEFRLYNKIISHDQFLSNYNNGIGNNPFETEDLMVWYKFEQFENLDFSVLQDGSDIRLGLKDFSGKANHAQPFNMITDSTSDSYVLKPF